MRGLGLFMGALTFVAGTIAIIPEGIIGVFGDVGSVADLGKGMGNIIALLLIFLIAYLLCSPDEFYQRHLGLTTASVAIATLGGLGLIVSVFFHPIFREASLGAALYAFFAFLGAFLALADAVVLFIRREKVMEFSNFNKTAEIEPPSIEDDS